MPSSCIGLIKKNYLISSVFGVSFSSLGVMLVALHALIPNYFFASIFVLKPNSPMVNLWLKNPLELRMNFYFFNWTNPEEFYNLDVKPKFNEVGPYTYLFDMEKINVKWNDNNTVTYETLRTWFLIDDCKNACTTDNITTVNAVTAFGANALRNWSYLMKIIASTIMTLTDTDLQMVGTAQKLLFEGYQQPFTDILNIMPFLVPEVPNLEKFAWLVFFNGSSTSNEICNSGNGINGNFEMLKWNYESHNPNFNAACSKVRGSTGEFFNNKMAKDYIGLFFSPFGRYLKFDFEKEVVVDGISGLKFSVGSSLLDNGTKVVGNDCYCNGECIPSGMLNLTAAVFNLPVFGSLPHYLDADPVYLNEVVGLKPEKMRHEMYIVVEPNTGIPLEAVLRLQFNLLIQPVEGVSVVEGSRQIFFPVWWFEQKVDVPRVIKVVVIIYLILPYLLLAVGSVLLIFGCSLLLFIAYERVFCDFFNKNKPYIGIEFTEIKEAGNLFQPIE